MSLYFLTLMAMVMAVTAIKKRPEKVVVCKKTDPNIHECVRDAIQKSLPEFIGGVPDLDIESIDPFKIDYLVVDKKRDGSPVSIDFIWQNVVITGIKNAKITSAKADWDNNMVSFEATFPEAIDVKGTYTVDGIVLILPIKGSGDFSLKLEGFKAHLKIHGKPTMKEGHKMMEVDRLAFTFDVDHLNSKYENLFNGDPMLGETMNAFLNENWRDILDEMKTSVETNFSVHFQEVAAKVFNEIPIDDIAIP